MLPEDLCTKTQFMNDLVNGQHCTIRSTKFRVSIHRGAAAPRGYLQFRNADLHVVYTWSLFHTQGVHFGLIETVLSRSAVYITVWHGICDIQLSSLLSCAITANGH